MRFVRTDAKSILQQIKRQEKQINLKRSWLLGPSDPESDQSLFKRPKFLKNNSLPESLLREDDMFYESAKTYVESAFGARQVELENHLVDMQSVEIPHIKRLISCCMDYLTTKGLYLLALKLTGGSVKFEKTRCKMKKFIKDYLSTVFGGQNYSHHQLEIFKQIFQLLTDPQNFQDNCNIFPTSGSLSCRSAVMKVLNLLKHLETDTLSVMHKKLKGVEEPIPQLQPHKHGWNKKYLIEQVKKNSEAMLSQLDKGDDLQEPLAKAMAVADLALKLKTGRQNLFLKEFYQFPPEIKSLRDDIMKAIWLTKYVVKVPVLRNLQLLIEPDAKITNRCLRKAFEKLLTEFLFKCADLSSIPKSLLQILDVINKNSSGKPQGFFLKESIDEEVDCILSVSAQTKQIFLDLLPDHDFNQDFADAYIEQFEESDDDNNVDNDNDSWLHKNRHCVIGTPDSTDSNYRAESIGEFSPFELHLTNSMDDKSGSLCPPDRGLDENLNKRYDLNECITDPDPRNGAANLSCEETKSMPTKHKICKNQYLAIQDVCDETSMLAYNLIGRLMQEFAKTKGSGLDSSQISYLRYDNQMKQGKNGFSTEKDAGGPATGQVTEELINSSMERLKMLVGLQ